MSKRTGEITEDYWTYAKHLLMAGCVGGMITIFLGAVSLWYLGLGTEVYTRITTGVSAFAGANPVFVVAIAAFILLVIFVLFRSRFAGVKN